MSATTGNQRWSQAWLQILHQLDLLGPRTAVGSGSRIRRMEVALGQVTAEVQDRTHGLCQITIQFAPLVESAWQGTLTIFQQQLAGVRLIEPHLAFPDSEPAFSALGQFLLPSNREELQLTCSCCPDGQNLRNCAALQTVYRQLGMMLDEEPVLLLRLRNHEWQQVIHALQQKPNGDYGRKLPAQPPTVRAQTQPDATNGLDTAVDRDDLNKQLGNFWGSRREMENFQHHITVPTIDLAILRRLGPLPEELADPVVDQQLSSLYRLISREAEAFAYDLDTEDTEDTLPEK